MGKSIYTYNYNEEACLYNNAFHESTYKCQMFNLNDSEPGHDDIPRQESNETKVEVQNKHV